MNARAQLYLEDGMKAKRGPGNPNFKGNKNGYIVNRKKAKKKGRLTPMQQNFILSYMANGHNATRAAISAGYSPKGADVQGWLLVHKNPRVEAEINRINTMAYKKNDITAEWILASLKGIAEACKVKRVEVDGEGNETEKGVVDSAGANRALELLGKNKKLFIDTMELTKRTEFADMTDEDLLQIIKASKKNIK